MDCLAGHRRARLGQAHDRRRDGQLLVLGRRLRHAAEATCPMPASSMPPALVNWQRAVKSPQELDYMRIAGRIVSAMHRYIVDSMTASRWTITGSRRPPSPRCSATCPMPASRTPRRWSTGSGGQERRRNSTTCARPARIVEAMHARILETVEPGMRKCDLVAEIYDAGMRWRRRLRRRLSGDRAAAAVGRGRRGAASDLGRQADARRARAPSSRSPAATTATIARCRARSSSASRPQTFLDAEKAVLEGMEAGLEAARAGQCLRGHRQCLLRRARSATASSRTTAPAIRSASPIRPTGASAP